jgi:hypothetical protein
MIIHYVPNDPRASAYSKPREQAARKDRPAGRARFNLGTMPPAKVYPVNSDGALAWQTREAAFAAVEVFEGLHGPVNRWARAPNRKVLDLVRDAGEDINAYYDGYSVSFYHQPVGSQVKFSGASADIVSHEVGHALLDTIRPELWDSKFPEVAAFHEAFGDCIAMLTEIADKDMRKDLVKVINKRNFIETFGEDLSWTVLKVKGAKSNPSKPRQARNKFQWVLPSSRRQADQRTAQLRPGLHRLFLRSRGAVVRERTEERSGTVDDGKLRGAGTICRGESGGDHAALLSGDRARNGAAGHLGRGQAARGRQESVRESWHRTRQRGGSRPACHGGRQQAAPRRREFSGADVVDDGGPARAARR